MEKNFRVQRRQTELPAALPASTAVETRVYTLKRALHVEVATRAITIGTRIRCFGRT